MKPGLMKTGGGIEPSTGELLDQRHVFTKNDKEVVAWASFDQAHGEHTARFKWFNPDGLLVLDSGPVSINPDDQLYEWRRVWSVLPIHESPASLMPGTWKVFVYQNQKKIGTLHFQLQ